ncbi:hypothetical protein KIPB_012591, partial [Kipferlia bialata]|eukprot:g12591.t1
MNRQPWSLTVGEGEVILREQGKGNSGIMTKRLDTGVALAHVLAQLAKDGKMGDVEVVSDLPFCVRIKQ